MFSVSLATIPLMNVNRFRLIGCAQKVHESNSENPGLRLGEKSLVQCTGAFVFCMRMDMCQALKTYLQYRENIEKTHRSGMKPEHVN